MNKKNFINFGAIFGLISCGVIGGQAFALPETQEATLAQEITKVKQKKSHPQFLCGENGVLDRISNLSKINTVLLENADYLCKTLDRKNYSRGRVSSRVEKYLERTRPKYNKNARKKASNEPKFTKNLDKKIAIQMQKLEKMQKERQKAVEKTMRVIPAIPVNTGPFGAMLPPITPAIPTYPSNLTPSSRAPSSESPQGGTPHNFGPTMAAIPSAPIPVYHPSTSGPSDAV